VKLSEIAEATGCSKAYPSDIRGGKWTPHLSTWGALAELIGISLEHDVQQKRGLLARIAFAVAFLHWTIIVLSVNITCQ
jgi:hypothetical protein